VKAFWTVLALLGSLLVQSALSAVFPAAARLFDPFLLVLVYCGLTSGETHAMLAGAAGGWVQDVYFGGHVLGLAGLTKVLIGFAVGVAATRFQLTEAGPRALVLLAAAAVDTLLMWGLAGAFDITVAAPGASVVAARSALNALLGVVFFGLLERRVLSARRA
jgi:rod shape-determining protein MreD